MILALLISLPFLYVIIRRPLTRRLAFRNVSRRPREAALVVLGSLLGTAIITGAFVVGDTLHRSLDDQAFEHLGPIDEVVALSDRARWLEASERLLGFRDPSIDGAAPMAVVSAPVASVGRQRQAAPRAQLIETDFVRAARMGTFAETGIDGATPRPGRAAASQQLADKLGVAPGDDVEVFAYGKTVRLQVDRILPQRGIAGFAVGYAAVADNLFVPPGTIVDLAGGTDTASFDVSPPAWLVAVSNRGDARTGVDRTEDATKALLAASRGLRADLIPAKQLALDNAVASGKSISTFFNAMGAFGVLAGVLLLINVIAMLAEERTTELGMMRAVGLTRTTFVSAFCAEGWVYSVLAGVLGTGAGVGLGRFMVGLTQRLYSSGSEAFGLDLTFTASPLSLQRGFSAGLLISMVTVVLTSVRVSRFDVIRAIRDLPDAPVTKRRLWPVLVGALFLLLGMAWSAAAAGTADPLGVVFGPTLALGGLVPILERSMSRAAAITLSSLTLVLWLAVGLQAVGLTPSGTSLVPLVLEGIVLVTAGVLLISQQQERIGAVLRRITRGGNGLVARLALAYPLARRFRTTLTLAPFTLVVFTLTFITAISGLITSEVENLAARAAGGYDVIVSSNESNPLDTTKLADRPGVAAIAPMAQLYATVAADPGITTTRPVSVIDEAVFAADPPQIKDLGDYGSKREAYEAVIRDPDLVLVTSAFMSGDNAAGEVENDLEPWEPGRTLTIIDPQSDQGRTYTVAAILSADVAFNGALVGRTGAEQLFSGRLVNNRAWVKLDGDATAFADGVEAEFVANGVQVALYDDVAEEVFAFILQIVNIYRSYLGLGLIVGTAGIGVVMIRAVRERRHQIGLLRSMGFDSGMVGRSFVYEAAFVAVEGIVLGVGLALLTTYSTSRSQTMFDLIGSYPKFQVPGWSLALLVGGTLLAALLAAAGPARSAARIPPSVALRMVD